MVVGYFGSNYMERFVSKISICDFDGIVVIMFSSFVYSKFM